MADELRLGAALLAAGASRRFGDSDKLAASFRGMRLGEHAALAVPKGRFAQKWVVTADPVHPCMPLWRERRFVPFVIGRAAEGMGTSAAMAAQLAQQAGLDALMIVLADMPMVPPQHLSALANDLRGPADIVCSAIADTPMPPAIFGREHFGTLAAMSGDRGARDLLAQARVATCPPEWLIDIDTPEMLEANARIDRQPGASNSKTSVKGDET